MRRVLLFVSLLVCASATGILASEEFYTKYEVDYVFDQKGNALVSQQISLTNKKSGIYASSYQMTLQGDLSPGVISGSDSQGRLKVTTEQPQPDTTLVKVDFNNQVVGLNNTLKFNLNYSGRSAAHNGQVWEVSLPRLGNVEAIDEYTLRLTVPESFGQLAFISPTPAVSSAHQYSFTKDQVSKVGVVAAFGNFQTFDFSLQFDLANPNSKPIIAEVAIPADTNYQRVGYTSIHPSPSDIEVDAEGNWLAIFKLLPQQNQTVVATGHAYLLADPVSISPHLTFEQKQEYLKPTTYWPTADPQIITLAQQLKTAPAIYNYVVQNLKYDYSRAKPGAIRKGGVEALKTPDSSICTEFTDLFVTLARAAGIPAREVNGFAYATDKRLRPASLVGDVFHAWPQYWDEKRQNWISIDPTWGHTTGGIDYFNKLDFNHFTFITRGLADTYPTITSQNVDVKYGIYTEVETTSPFTTWQPPKFVWPYLSNRSILTVTNPTGSAIYKLPLAVTSANITSSYFGPTDIPVLPPFTTRSYPVVLHSSFWPNFRPKSLVVVVGDQFQAYNVEARLFLPWQIILGILTAIIITALAWLTLKVWGVYLQKRFRENSIRGQS